MTLPSDLVPRAALGKVAGLVGYARREAAVLSLDLAAAAALALFQRGIEAGHGEQDIAAVVERFRSNSNESHS